MNLQDKIKFERKRQDLSQEVVAMRVGLSVSQYSAFERGVRNLSFDKFIALLDALGLGMYLADTEREVYIMGRNNESILLNKLSLINI